MGAGGQRGLALRTCQSIDHDMAASNKVVLSRLLTVLCLPVTAPLLLAYALVVGVGTAALPKRARQKAHAAAIRVLTMGGPWGTCFDALTWHPWTAGVPSCIYAGVEPSDGKGLVVPVSKLCARAAGTLRLVVISDTHGKHHQLSTSLPEGDILVHSGDLLSRNASIGFNSGGAHWRALAALRDFNEWLGALPHAHKIVVAGNHDGVLESVGRERARALLSNAVYLEDEVCMVGGLRVGGSPWSATGGSANRAFQSERPRLLQPDLRPSEPLDLLVMHFHHSEAAATLRPRVFASGHVHDAHGVWRAPWGLEVRASVCDGLYRAVQLPVVVDVPVRDPPGPFS